LPQEHPGAVETHVAILLVESLSQVPGEEAFELAR
jgi:hypothetical protein